MSYTDKIDILDLIIATLREHEQTLNILAERLEALLDGPLNKLNKNENHMEKNQ